MSPASQPCRMGLRWNLPSPPGAVDPVRQVTALDFESSTAAAALIGRGRGYRIEAVRWPVWENVFAEGLLLEPDRRPVTASPLTQRSSTSRSMSNGMVRLSRCLRWMFRSVVETCDCQRPLYDSQGIHVAQRLKHLCGGSSHLPETTVLLNMLSKVCGSVSHLASAF